MVQASGCWLMEMKGWYVDDFPWLGSVFLVPSVLWNWYFGDRRDIQP